MADNATPGSGKGTPHLSERDGKPEIVSAHRSREGTWEEEARSTSAEGGRRQRDGRDDVGWRDRKRYERRDKRDYRSYDRSPRHRKHYDRHPDDGRGRDEEDYGRGWYRRRKYSRSRSRERRRYSRSRSLSKSRSRSYDRSRSRNRYVHKSDDRAHGSRDGRDHYAVDEGRSHHRSSYKYDAERHERYQYAPREQIGYAGFKHRISYEDGQRSSPWPHVAEGPGKSLGGLPEKLKFNGVPPMKITKEHGYATNLENKGARNAIHIVLKPQQERPVDGFMQKGAAGSLRDTSPDVTKYLEDMADLQQVRFHELAGLDQPEEFLNALKSTNARLVRYGKLEATAWKSQQQEAKRLRVMLGLGDAPVNDAWWPMNHDGERSDVPPMTSSGASKDRMPTIPFEELEVVQKASKKDPRSNYGQLYAMLQRKWSRPMELPRFSKEGDDQKANPMASAGGSRRDRGKEDEESMPTYSWSHDATAGVEANEVSSDVAHVKDPSSLQGTKPDLQHSLPLSGSARDRHKKRRTRTSLEETPSQIVGIPTGTTIVDRRKRRKDWIELEEGIFEATIPDGGRKEAGQFSALCAHLVSRNIVPSGWPAFRSLDGLWAPLKPGLKLSDVLWPAASSDSKSKEAGTSERSSVEDSWLDTALNNARTNEYIDSQRTPDLAQEIAALAGGGERCDPLDDLKYTVWVPGKTEIKRDVNSVDVDFDRIAMERVKEEMKDAVHICKKRSERLSSLESCCVGSNRAVASRAVPPAHLISGVHNAILVDNSSIRKVLRGLLNHATREARK